jgi:hypothetical protein
VIAALVVGRVFGDIHGRATILSTQSESLQEAQADQQDRCDDADAGISRQHPDQERRHSHQEHRHKKGVLSPNQIPKSPEKRRAKRPDDESRRERQQGEHKSGGLVHAGKELLGDGRGQGTVQKKVIPLEDSSEGCGQDQLPVASEKPRDRTNGG